MSSLHSLIAGLLIGLIPNLAGAFTLQIPELGLSVPETEEYVSPWHVPVVSLLGESEAASLRLLGKGVASPEGEILALTCLRSQPAGSCVEAQASSLRDHKLFLFGPKYKLKGDNTKSIPSVFFERSGWNWASRPDTLGADRFHRLKLKLAKRIEYGRLIHTSKKKFVNSQVYFDYAYGHDAIDTYNLGARRCFRQLLLHRIRKPPQTWADFPSETVLRREEEVPGILDLEAQLLESFAADSDCTGMSDLSALLKIEFLRDHGGYYWTYLIQVSDASGQPVALRRGETGRYGGKSRGAQDGSKEVLQKAGADLTPLTLRENPK